MLSLFLLACDRPTAELQSVVSADPRNVGLSFMVGCGEYLSCDNLTFDVLSDGGSPADVSRVFFQFAETQKDKSYERVYLAAKGEPKFYVAGAYFKQAGTDYPTENPIYLLNHFPENVKALDGSPAFGTWTGGWLGVATRQMDDLLELHRKWWGQ